MPFWSAIVSQLSLKCIIGLLVLERQRMASLLIYFSISILEQYPEGTSQRSFLVTVPGCVTRPGAELLPPVLKSCAASPPLLPLGENKWLVWL